MKLMLKIVIALAVLATAAIVYADVPDVSKWVCSSTSDKNEDYDVVITECESVNLGSLYVKVSGELIYIHEHRTDADKTVYYNALSTNGWWVEVINKKDFLWSVRQTKNGDVEVSIEDDNGVVVAKRTIPLLKK